MTDVLCMGELLAEFVATESNVSLIDAPGFLKAPGGAPANVAVAIQRLGMDAGFIGKVGDDPFGEYLRQSLAETGVNTSRLFVDAHARTTAVFVAVWDDGRKDLCFYRNPGADMLLDPDDIDPAIFAGVRCFHFGSIGLIDEPAASAQRKAIQIAREQGLMISYDPNYRPTLWPDEATARAVIQEAFQHCHLAKISEEEWAVATGTDDLDEGIQTVLDWGVELLIISRGPKGAIATNGQYRIELPALSNINIVETTGAGDGFMAAMITRLLPERERLDTLADVEEAYVRDALEFANVVGGLTCTHPGAIPALPHITDVIRFIAERDSA